MAIIEEKRAPSWVTYSDGTVVPTGQVHRTFERDFSRPITNKRPKPKDLFGNATPRIVRSHVYEYTYGTLKGSPWNGASTTAPFTYWVGNVMASPPFQRPASVSDFAYLDSRLRSKIKDQNVNLAVTLAEYRQTSNLLLGAARDIIRTFNSLRAGRALRDFVSMLSNPQTRNGKRLANRWLEYQYGWRPLLSDVHGMAEAMAKKIKVGFYVHNGVRDRRAGSSPISYVLGGGSTFVDLTLNVKGRYFICDSTVKQLSELGFSNPAAWAWERIPWSFVIDWVIPVGDYLNGLDALNGVSDLRINRSYRWHCNAHQTLDYVSGSNYGFVQKPQGRFSEKITERFAPSNSLSLGSLRYEPSLTKTRLANAVALLRQLKR